MTKEATQGGSSNPPVPPAPLQNTANAHQKINEAKPAVVTKKEGEKSDTKTLPPAAADAARAVAAAPAVSAPDPAAAKIPAPSVLKPSVAAVPVVHVDMRSPGSLPKSTVIPSSAPAAVPSKLPAPKPVVPVATTVNPPIVARVDPTSRPKVVARPPAKSPVATKPATKVTTKPVTTPKASTAASTAEATKSSSVAGTKHTAGTMNAGIVVPPPATKKRKSNPTPLPAPSQQQPTPAQHQQQQPLLLADSSVVQTVHDIIGLLQQYGPLTKAQLEFNLTPMRAPPLSDILDLIVATGVVQVVHLGGTATTASDQHVYCVLSGQTRPPADTPVLPQDVLPALIAAQKEYKASLQRAAILRDLIMNPKSASHPRQVLQGMLKEHGSDMRNDPVYMAAMRNLGVMSNTSSGGGSSRGSKK